MPPRRRPTSGPNRSSSDGIATVTISVATLGPLRSTSSTTNSLAAGRRPRRRIQPLLPTIKSKRADDVGGAAVAFDSATGAVALIAPLLRRRSAAAVGVKHDDAFWASRPRARQFSGFSGLGVTSNAAPGSCSQGDRVKDETGHARPVARRDRWQWAALDSIARAHEARRRGRPPSHSSFRSRDGGGLIRETKSTSGCVSADGS